MGTLPYGKSLRPGPLALLAALAVVLVAGAAGWVAAAQLTSEPEVATPEPLVVIPTGAAELQLRSGWRLVPRVPRVPGLDVPDAKALAPADGGRGRMVVALVPGTDASSELPEATVDALRVPLAASERASIGGLRGVGYTALSLQGVSGLVDLYAVQTPAGLLTIACIAPIDDPLPAESCPGDVSSVSIDEAAIPDPTAELREALPAIAAPLNRERVAGRLALRRGKHSDAQARAARSLWRAYRTAASAVAPLAPESGVGSELPATLREAARAYRALGVAASRHSERGWSRARRAVTAAERAVTAQLDALGES